jgi:hypothetical protein
VKIFFILHKIITNLNYVGWCFFNNSNNGRIKLEKFVRFFRKKEFKDRVNIYKYIVNEQIDDINEDIGFKKIVIKNEKITQALLKINKFETTIDWEKYAPFTAKKHLRIYHLNPDHLTELNDIIFSKEILYPSIKYLKEAPILQMAAIWHSPNLEIQKGSSQFFHIDGESTRQVRVLFPLKEIDSDSGPMHVIFAKDSQAILERLNNSGANSISDRVLDDQFNDVKKTQLVGNFGDCFLIDTNRCYHYGSRPSTSSQIVKSRTLLSLTFGRYSNADMPFFYRNYSYNNSLKNLVLDPLRHACLYLWKNKRYHYDKESMFRKSN